MTQGFFTPDSQPDDGPSLDEINYRKALAQMLMQQDDSNRPYTGLKNFGNSIAGALMMRNALREDKTNYGNQIARSIGANNYAPITPTPRMQQGQAFDPNNPAYNQPTQSFQPGSVSSALGLTPENAQAFAGMLGSESPETGRSQLNQLTMSAILPKPLEWHKSDESGYDARGHLVIQGSPESAYKPGQIVTYEDKGMKKAFMIGPDGKTMIPVGSSPAFKPDKADDSSGDADWGTAAGNPWAKFGGK